MVALLAEIASKARDENRYQGDKLARDLGREIAALGSDSPLELRWRLHRLAGVAELRAGNEEKGVALLIKAYGLLPELVATIGAGYAAETTFQLGVGFLRIGETQNCCNRFTPESCIAPIQGGGIHTVPEGSRRAIECFSEVLRNLPPDHDLHLASLWLLNIAHMTLGEYPHAVPPEHRLPESAFRSEVPFPRFPNIARKLGLDRFNCSGGVIIDDFDGDERLDILSSTWEPNGQIIIFAADGKGGFEDRTAASGLEGITGGLNLVPADHDNDGDLDFLVLRGAWLGKAGRLPNSLVRNDGGLTFTDVTFESGLGDVHYPTQTAGWADYDNDGDLDVYIGNETTEDIACPSQLFENQGDGTFRDVAARAGVTNDRFAKGVSWGDYDNDGDPDLYVSNLMAENRLYRNHGDGTFADVAREAGVTRPSKSFPVWFWDYDNDGNLDIFVSSFDGKAQDHARHYLKRPRTCELACLYRGDGRGGFSDVAVAAGLDFPMLAMGSNFGDLDGDGFLDLYLGTGDPEYASLIPNLMLVSRAGERFVDVTMAGGFGHLQKGHAVSFADIDGDGDVDVFEKMGGAYLGDRFRDVLFENPGFGNRWLVVRCVGTRSNRSAIGARIRVDVETEAGVRTIRREVSSGGSFGANPLSQTIGLGKCLRIRLLEVRWPASGTAQRFADVPLDSRLRIEEGNDRLGGRG
jgi:hypothetical protein